MFNIGDACVVLVAFFATCVVSDASVGRKKTLHCSIFCASDFRQKRRTRRKTRAFLRAFLRAPLHIKRRCSDTDNDPDRCSVAVWSLESCHTDRSPATNDAGANRRQNRRGAEPHLDLTGLPLHIESYIDKMHSPKVQQTPHYNLLASSCAVERQQEGALCGVMGWDAPAFYLTTVWLAATIKRQIFSKYYLFFFLFFFILTDLLLFARFWKEMRDPYMVCHHFAVIYAYGYVLNRGVLPYFANFRLISELSTPFVNQRWFFDAVNMPRSSKPFLVNALAMAVVFFLVRIAVIPSYYSQVFATFGTEGYIRLGIGPQVAWIVSSVILDILNVFWMYKIMFGFYRVVKSKPGGKPTRNHAD
ncbi:unnamed protein product [Ranitomeya imitator]|uniref:TLC domain-containing protein n=1 Tax=Ranitomeya imitator TaxID=111125 RepID=A0ABN9LAT6_9NEOB|nr:unnamed protein product [Ranitomeya imitator]